MSTTLRRYGNMLEVLALGNVSCIAIDSDQLIWDRSRLELLICPVKRSTRYGSLNMVLLPRNIYYQSCPQCSFSFVHAISLMWSASGFLKTPCFDIHEDFIYSTD